MGGRSWTHATRTPLVVRVLLPCRPPAQRAEQRAKGGSRRTGEGEAENHTLELAAQRGAEEREREEEGEGEGGRGRGRKRKRESERRERERRASKTHHAERHPYCVRPYCVTGPAPGSLPPPRLRLRCLGAEQAVEAAVGVLAAPGDEPCAHVDAAHWGQHVVGSARTRHVKNGTGCWWWRCLVVVVARGSGDAFARAMARGHIH